MGRMTVSIVIPTYQRPQALGNCIRSILANTIRPEEIVVVGRQGDTQTELALDQLRGSFPAAVCLRSTWVTERGHVPPVEAGVHFARGEVVAFLDDDVTLDSGWIASILPHFADTSVGVVGGRVFLAGAPVAKRKGKPGRISWYGKLWGNLASLDGDCAIEVDSVMEGNWAWRRSLLASLRFDAALNFDDAVMYGLDLCLQAREKGFRVLCEPRAVAHHFPAPRVPELDRADRPRRTFAYCRNYTYILLNHLHGWRRVAFLGWWFLVGERGGWGPGAIAADTLIHGFRWRNEAGPSFAGKVEGLRLWLKR